MILKGVSPVTLSYDPRFLACLARQNELCLFVLSTFQKVQFPRAIKRATCEVVIYRLVCSCDLQNHNTERSHRTRLVRFRKWKAPSLGAVGQIAMGEDFVSSPASCLLV